MEPTISTNGLQPPKWNHWLIGAASALVIAASIVFIYWWTTQKPETTTSSNSADSDTTNQTSEQEDSTEEDNSDTEEELDLEKLTDKEVAAYLVYWDQTAGFETIQTHHDLFTAVNPFWYTLDATGELILFENAEDTPIVDYCHTKGIVVLPVISNEQSAETVQAIIHNPTTRATHIENIVNTVIAQGYDGIEIDYENLARTDRSDYSKFITDLAVALHAENKLLATALHAKTSAEGTWGGPAAQDWVAIGSVADSIKIMTYDYHWSTSVAGDIAPLSWMEDVYDYAVTVIPPEKIQIGIHLYAYDWVGQQADYMNYTELLGLVAQYNPTIRTSSAQEKYFTYREGNSTHTVYFSDASVVAPRAAYSLEYNTGGLAFWSLGNEDPATWDTVITSLTSED